MRLAAFALFAAALLAPGAAVATPACTLAGVGEDRWCTVAGVRLHLVDWGGDGAPLILLAGLNNSARIFDDFAPRLTRHRHVYAFTRRGFGLSDQPSAGYDTATRVADIVRLMDALGIHRADIVGHSIAGGEMTALATVHPERVRRLVYLDAAYDRAAIATFPRDPAGSRAPTPAAHASRAALADWRARQLGFESGAVAADIDDSYVKEADDRLVPRTPAAIVTAISASDRAIPPDYGALAVPALALYAPKDRAEQPSPEATPEQREASRQLSLKVVRPWMLREHARFLGETRCARAEILRGTAHYMFLQRPREIAAQVVRFLDARLSCDTPSAGQVTFPRAR